jgi:Flp pilus assembly protein TadD
LKVNPDYAEARNNLALAYFEAGDLANAKRQYRTLVMINPLLSEPHFDLGVIAYQEKDDEEAIRELRRAVELEPQYAAAWLHLGVVYDHTGRFKEAADAFNVCLDADANEGRCRTGLAAEQERLSTRSSGRRSPF